MPLGLSCAVEFRPSFVAAHGYSSRPMYGGHSSLGTVCVCVCVCVCWRGQPEVLDNVGLNLCKGICQDAKGSLGEERSER